MSQHSHLTILHQLYLAEAQPFRKVHRMIDLFESLIKTYTLVIIGEYFKRNQLSDSAKGLLAAGLRTPSLGTWQLFSRELYKELILSNHVFLSEAFPKEFEDLDKALNNQKTNIISFRNGYAHGATPSDADCEKDINQFEPFLERLLASTWIANTDIIEKEGKAILFSLQNNDELSLHPLLISKAEKESQPFAFFNDLKDDKVGLLNYPLSKHYREKEFFSEFNSYLPIKEWKKNGSSEFNHRIDELTETFKGRIREREAIKQFVESKSKGYLSIQGNPGIGKSALIAKVYIDLTNKDLNLPIYIVPYFIRRGTAQTDSLFLLNYLLKNTDHYFSEGRNINAEGKSNWDLQQQLFSKWRAYGESKPKNKLVFLIDGLDEGVENEILRYLPRENFNHVLIIYGSRPGGHKQLESFWSELPIENHSSLLLAGLNQNDIRALLYEVSNKYEIEKNSIWIETIEKRSEGNPLYLKLLCNAIENGSITLNDPDALPKEIDDYYKAILDRYANNEMDGDSLLNSLYTFAAALDYLTPDHLKAINGLGEAQSQRVESTLKEVLYENPLTEEVLDYQLFHESFREYLFKNKSNGVKQASERILKYCSDWEKLKGSFEQRYPLQHYAPHLSKLINEENINTLLALANNDAYINTQKKVLQGFEASKELFRISLTKSIENKKNTEAINAALKLIDLKYEEQNDVVSIIAMVANNQIDIALQRITSFGGSNKEDKQRQFILFMLCFMELTLLASKEKPWRKSAIEKILNHFEEQIPIDHSILNWKFLFPSNLMFLIAVEFSKLNIDFTLFYLRTTELDNKWLTKKRTFSDIEFDVLLSVVSNNNIYDSESIYQIAMNLVAQGKIESAIKCTLDISSSLRKSQIFAALSNYFHQIGNDEESIQMMRKACENIKCINDEQSKSTALIDVSISFAKQSKKLKAKETIQQAIEYTHKIKFEDSKSEKLELISEYLAEHDDIEEAIFCAQGIKIDFNKIKALLYISDKLYEQGKILESDKLVSQTIQYTQNISDSFYKSLIYNHISLVLTKQGKQEFAGRIIELAINCANEISDFSIKGSALTRIALSLEKHGNLDLAISCLNNINTVYKSKAFAEISLSLSQKGNDEQSNEAMIKAIDNAEGFYKNSAFKKIFQTLTEQNKIMNLSNVMQNSLNTIPGFNSVENLFASSAFAELSVHLANFGDHKISNEYFKKITNKKNKIKSLALISICLINEGRIQEVLDKIESIKGVSFRSSLFAHISMYTARDGKLDLAKEMIQKANYLAKSITFQYEKNEAFFEILLSLNDQDDIKQAIDCIEFMSDDYKIKAYASISTNYYLKEKIENAREFMQKTINLGLSISNDHKKSIALKVISLNFAYQGEILNALAYAEKNNIDRFKNEAFSSIALILASNGNYQFSFEISKKIFRGITKLEFWMKLAENDIKLNDWRFCKRQLKILPNDEAKTFYKKGIVEALLISEATEEIVFEILNHIKEDAFSIEILICKHALYSILFTNPEKDQFNKFNNSLNLQWALDIKAKFNKEDIIKSSDNLDEWINDISDEDDKEQVLLWAKQVSKGKISEQDFLNHIKSIVKNAN